MRQEDHEALRVAAGDVAYLPDLDENADDSDGRADYIATWGSPRALRLTVVGECELSGSVVVHSPELFDPGKARAFRAGTYELVTITEPSFGDVLAVIVRTRDPAKDVRWLELRQANDAQMVVVDADVRWEDILWPADREYLDPNLRLASQTLWHERTADGKALVWLHNTGGNGIKPFAAITADERTVAVLFELQA